MQKSPVIRYLQGISVSHSPNMRKLHLPLVAMVRGLALMRWHLLAIAGGLAGPKVGLGRLSCSNILTVRHKKTHSAFRWKLPTTPSFL